MRTMSWVAGNIMFLPYGIYQHLNHLPSVRKGLLFAFTVYSTDPLEYPCKVHIIIAR